MLASSKAELVLPRSRRRVLDLLGMTTSLEAYSFQQHAELWFEPEVLPCAHGAERVRVLD